MQSLVLYITLICGDTRKIKYYEGMLIYLLRKHNLKVISSNIMSSAEAVRVVAGMIAIDLIVDEKVTLY